MYIISNRYQKPPIGTQLNLAHPSVKGLTHCWLMNEGEVLNKIIKSGAIYDMVTKRVGTSNSTTSTSEGATYQATSKGIGLFFTDAHSAITQVTVPNFTISDPMTIEWLVHPTAGADPASYFSDNSSGNGFFRRSANNIGFIFYDGGGSNRVSVPLSWVPQGDFTHIVFTYSKNGSPGSIYFLYMNGIQAATGSTTAWNLSMTLNRIGGDDFVQSFVGHIMHIRTWNRMFQQSEVYDLYNEPYAMFQKPTTRLFFPLAAGGSSAGGSLLSSKHSRLVVT